MILTIKFTRMVEAPELELIGPAALVNVSLCSVPIVDRVTYTSIEEINQILRNWGEFSAQSACLLLPIKIWHRPYWSLSGGTHLILTSDRISEGLEGSRYLFNHLVSEVTLTDEQFALLTLRGIRLVPAIKLSLDSISVAFDELDPSIRDIQEVRFFNYISS